MGQLKIKKTKINKNILLIILGLLIIFVSSVALVYNYYSNKNMEKIEDKSIEVFFEEQITDDKESQEETPKEEEKKTEVVIDYKAILEIPKINLKRGIVDKNSSYNNVNKNIYIVKETTFPDEQKESHIILAAHSGNSYVSFFRNLNKLSFDDKVYFYYANKKYIYNIVKRYEIEKSGKLNFRLTDGSDMTLITCISGTNKQVVYVAKLISEENY